MSNLVALLDDIERRGKEMPALLQQALQDGGQLQSHLEASTQSARTAVSMLEDHTKTAQGLLGNLNARVQNEHQRQSGRLAEATAGLHELHKLGQTLAQELAEDSRQTETTVGQLTAQLNSLSQSVFTGIDQGHTALTEGLGKIRQSQERLAATCTKVVHNVSEVSDAVKKSSEVCSEAINRYLTSFQKVVTQGAAACDGLLDASRKALNRLDEDLTRLHAETVGPQVLSRASLYVQSVTELKGAANGAFYTLQSAGQRHDVTVAAAKTALDEGYRLHRSYTEGKATSAKSSLTTADGHLDRAWKAIPLDDKGNKDTRNFIQKTLDGLKGFAVAAWEAAVWVVKGVTKWVADNHQAILAGLVTAAVVAGAVVLAPFVWPVLVATAPTILATVGGALVAGLALVGSAAGGIGLGVLGIGAAGAAFAIGTQALTTSPMQFLANVGSTISKLPGAIVYTSSRFLTFASKGPNALGLVASLVTLNPLPLIATMAVTTTIGAFEMSKDLADPKRVQPPETFVTKMEVHELERVFALAKMGNNVFSPTQSDASKTSYAGDGYVFKGPAIEDSDKSFRAEVYEKRNPPGDPKGTLVEAVLVFRGSTMDNLGQNWAQNIQQGAGWEAYGPNSIYQKAVEVARQMESKYKDKLTLTGHSLGGSLVQVASAVVNRPGVTFNSAGVNPLTYNAFNVVREDAKNTNFDVAGQLLDQLQDGMASGAAMALTVPTGFVTGPLLPSMAVLASDSQVAGKNYNLGARKWDGTSLMDHDSRESPGRKNTTFDLHLWGAVEQSVAYELNQARAAKNLDPIKWPPA